MRGKRRRWMPLMSERLKREYLEVGQKGRRYSVRKLSRKWYGFANGCLEVRGFDEWGGLLVVIVNAFGKSGVFF